MPIGIVSDAEFNTELIHIEHAGLGRGVGRENVPNSLRKVIAETAIMGGNAESARAFGVSTASVAAYKNGATSTATYNSADAGLKKHVDDVREKIGTIAKSTLLRALSHITEENLSASKPRDLAGIAKDMSTVVNNMSPQGPTIQNNAQFVFHTYKDEREENYEVIDVVDVR